MATRLIPIDVEQQLQQALEQERERLLKRVRLEQERVRSLGVSQAEESGPGGGEADVATDLMQQEIDLALERAEQARLEDVQDALQRIAAGTYGRCEPCGGPIDLPRLRALPWTRYCSADAAAAATGRAQRR